MIKRIIALLAVSTMFLGAAHARKVSGTVTCGEELLEGVIVTDGANFTTTNFKGKFAFEINDDAEHVYIVTPDGYVADWTSGVPAFYQKAEGKNKFAFDLASTLLPHRVSVSSRGPSTTSMPPSAMRARIT